MVGIDNETLDWALIRAAALRIRETCEKRLWLMGMSYLDRRPDGTDTERRLCCAEAILARMAQDGR